MKYLLLITLVWMMISAHSYSQTSSQEFNIRYETSVKGEMKIIGNNIVNRQDRRNKANVPFDDRSNKVKMNDEFDMQYIDIDDNPDTFSSSSANFSFEGKENAKVIYAGLYWTATYPYALGVLKGKNYKAKQSNREIPDNVMIKTPSNEEYSLVKGELIFDGIGDSSLEGVAPYVYYADVSQLLTDSSMVEGEYTVANVRAANGHIAGGVAAGWALVLVYESLESSEKKIITYDGFSTINNQPKTFNFRGFLTPKENAFQAKVMGAVLEGDFSISGDKVMIYNPVTEVSLDLETGTRSPRNFFNSGITENDTFVMNRNPASKNTLGFDIFSFDIPNENQLLIPNGTNSLGLTFTRSADQYYLFLTALQIENIRKEIDVNQFSEIGSENSNFKYYVVVGVYINRHNMLKQVEKLKKLGYEAHTIYNEERNLNYIYIEKYDTYKEASLKAEELKAIANIPDTWVLKMEDLSE
ncbi:MAG: SPOR domain-containing protein [Capnocytophaga felis]|nr:SPOR domain-containing protein [Capnocytophaga felis]